MRIQVFSARTVMSGYLLGSVFALLAAPIARGDCFDFNQEIRQGPAHRRSVHFSSEEPAPGQGTRTTSGELSSGIVWAAAEQRATKGLNDILADLGDHEITRSGRIDEFQVLELPDKHFLRHQKVKFVIKPFPFVNISWTEDWAFTLLAGSPNHPERALVAYEKTEGTSHIRHLCGAYELRAVDPGHTDVFVYEEAKATSRSQQDTLDGLRGTLTHFSHLQQENH
jgi:hypothetical protein